MFLETTFPSKFYLYQFGNGTEDFVVFPKSNLTCRVGHTVKLAEVENNLFDGKVRLNSGKRNKLGAATLEVNFAWPQNNYFDLHKLKAVFFSGLKPIFFYTYDKQADTIRFFYNPFAEAVEIVSQEQSPSSDLGADFEWVRVKLQLLFPFVYDCGVTSELSFYDYFNYALTSGIENLFYGKPGLVYGGVPEVYYGQQASNPELITTKFVTLTSAQRKSLFVNREQGPVLVWKEWFFQPLLGFVYMNEDQLVEVLDISLNNNNDVFFNGLFSTFLDTSAENKIYTVYLGTLASSVFNTIGQSVLIENVDNNSDLIIEWQSSQPAPQDLFFLSYTQLLYNYSTGQPIPLERYKIYQTKPDFLYFSALGRQNKIFAAQTEKLRFKKNSSNNIQVKIHALPTYVL